MTEIGEKIRLLRKRMGLSKKDFAKQVGISGYYVNRLEEDESSPTLEVIDKLAKAANVDSDYFVRGILDDLDMLSTDNFHSVKQLLREIQ